VALGVGVAVAGNGDGVGLGVGVAVAGAAVGLGVGVAAQLTPCTTAIQSVLLLSQAIPSYVIVPSIAHTLYDCNPLAAATIDCGFPEQSL
jgi:hypothetical protein